MNKIIILLVLVIAFLLGLLRAMSDEVALWKQLYRQDEVEIMLDRT